MASKSCTTAISSSSSFLLLLLLSFLLFSSTGSAFNITNILGQNSDFSAFNNYLTQTQLAGQINSRQTITVLAVDNAAISAVSGRPTDVIKKVLSLHVVLDYYDVDKLQKLSKKTALLTTLFQSSGQATGQMGFLNATDLTSGAVALGSAVAGAGLNAKLVKSVASHPYNISVLQISSVIVPPGIENTNQSSAPPPAATPKQAPTPKKAPTPAAAPSKSTPPPAASPSNKSRAPSGASPSPSDDDDAETPAAATPAQSPDSGTSPTPSDDSSSDAPSADAPVASSPPRPGAPAPSSDETSDDGAEAPGPSDASSGSRVVSGTSLVAVVGVALLAAL